MRRAVGALAIAVALSACGSTVQQSSTATVGGDGLSGGGGGTTGGGATTGTALPGTSGTGGATTGTAAPLASQAATGLGVTATTINIGIGYSSDGDAANAAIGAAAFTQGDEKANSKALVDEINAHGGVAGRKLVPIYHAYNLTSTQPGSAQDQAACQDWTVDHKVIAVMSSSLTDTLVACLQQKGVLQFKAGQIVDADQAYLQRYSNEILLATMSQDRIFSDQSTSLSRQKWYTGWNPVSGAPGPTTKVGVITYDNASFTRSLKTVILPRLRAAGHAPADPDVIQVHKVEQQSDAAGTAAQIKGAVLKLQSDGVTHVVLGDASGLILEFFGSNARTQGYYPRLGVTSGAAPYAIYQAGLVTAQQLNGMAGNGWMPTLDIPASDGNRYSNSETKRCLEILKRRTGQTYTSTNAATIALGDCDSAFLFKKGMELAPALTPAGLLAGLQKIGSSYTSPTVGPTFLSARQHDTAVRSWDLNWIPSCSCVRYTAERRVPSV
jgi:hypothetical protein